MPKLYPIEVKNIVIGPLKATRTYNTQFWQENLTLPNHIPLINMKINQRIDIESFIYFRILILDINFSLKGFSRRH